MKTKVVNWLWPALEEKIAARVKDAKLVLAEKQMLPPDRAPKEFTFEERQ